MLGVLTCMCRYTFWSSDFHVSPIADLKDLFLPMGMHVVDKSLSRHCSRTSTCAKDLKVSHCQVAEIYRRFVPSRQLFRVCFSLPPLHRNTFLLGVIFWSRRAADGGVVQRASSCLSDDHFGFPRCCVPLHAVAHRCHSQR